MLETDTEPVEILVSAFSFTLGIITLSLVTVTKANASQALLFLESVMNIRLWVILLLLTAGLKFFGVLFRLDLLRLIGCWLGVMIWTTIAASLFHFSPTVFAWSTYALLALANGWCFVRISLWKSELLVRFVKGVLRHEIHTKSSSDGGV